MVDSEIVAAPQGPELCRRAIAGGTDMILVAVPPDNVPPQTEDGLKGVAEVCRTDDALLVLQDNASLAAGIGAQGVHLSRSDISIGLTRSILGPGSIVGLSSRTLDEMMLGLELGIDYVVHHAGRDCPAAFSALHGQVGVPLFAGDISGAEEAGQIVAGGVLRLCMDFGTVDQDNVTESMAAYSRLLGRSI
jgi:thiamine-phosphate pyrophosphorylase